MNEVGFYWTSTAYSVYAWDLGIHSGAFGLFYGLRDYGRSVRPVRGSRVAYSVKTVHLSLDSATNVYQVIFADGAKRTTEFYAANKVYNLPTSLFTPPTGKRFAGWLGSNGRRYDPGVLVFNLMPVGGTVVLTAIWE